MLGTAAAHGRVRSALGEHLVVALVVALVVLSIAATIPVVVTKMQGTASKAQHRVDAPLDVGSSLDESTSPPRP